MQLCSPIAILIFIAFMYFRKPKSLCKSHNFNDQFKLHVVFFFNRARTYRVKKPHNLTDNSPNKKHRFLRVHKISFMLYLIIILRRTCTWIYQELTSNIKEHTENRIGFNWDMLRDPGLTITLIRGTHNS